MSDFRPPSLMCARCLHGLTSVEQGPFLFYTHALPRLLDHEPDPVPQDDRIILVCDFCTSEPAPHTALCLPFFKDSTPGEAAYDDDGEWQCCDQCRPLIEARDWDELLSRARSIMGPEAATIGVTLDETDPAPWLEMFREHFSGSFA